MYNRLESLQALQTSRNVILRGSTEAPKELALIISDVEQGSLSGDTIRLIIAPVDVGQSAITPRVDTEGPLNGIEASVPSAQVPRIINLFRSGGSVKFVTDRSTFAFPLSGAGQGIQNMQTCLMEVANLPVGQP